MPEGTQLPLLRRSRFGALDRRKLSLTPGAEGRIAAGIYQPGSAAGKLARAMTLKACCHKRTSVPAEDSKDLQDLCSRWRLRPDGIAAMNGSWQGRRIVGLVNDGELTAVVKVGCQDDAGIRREIAFLQDSAHSPKVPGVIFSTLTPAPALGMHAVHGSTTESWTVALEALRWMAEEELTHGDFAPWNLLSTSSNWTVIDWESKHDSYAPLHDAIHWVYQQTRLLHTMSIPDMLDAILRPEGPIGRFAASIEEGTSSSRQAAFGNYLDVAPKDRFWSRVVKELA